MMSNIKAIKCKCHPHSISFHPIKREFAVALVSGQIEQYRWIEDKEQFQKKLSVIYHTNSCRKVRYFMNNDLLLSCGADCRCIIYNEAGDLLWKKKAHKTAVNTVSIIGNTIFSSGDDEGIIKLWDFRISTSTEACWFKETQGYITDIKSTHDGQYLLSCCGNFLQVFDIRMPKTHVIGISNPEEHDLLSLELIKEEKLIVCGNENGTLDLYNWGKFTDPFDKIHRCSSSIESILQIDQNIICIGSSDGQIKLISISPNKILGILSNHANNKVLIQEISSNSDKDIIASCGSDEMIQFHHLNPADWSKSIPPVERLDFFDNL